MSSRNIGPSFVSCGRTITGQEIKEIQETIRLFPSLSHKELIQTICEHLQWYTAAGANKTDACTKMLEKLERKKIIQLPEKRVSKKPEKIKQHKISITSRTEPQPVMDCKLKELGNVTVEIANDKGSVELFNEFIMRYHYLGYKKPFGYTMRYFIKSNQNIIGCILFSGAAKSITVRDKWIGWTENQRLNNLAWVINNSRFLLFPWVKVKNLVSYIWGQILRNIQSDWQNRWGFTPVLLETFVDPALYNGSSYKASNFKYIGMTKGTGLVRKAKSYTTTPKDIYIKPLTKNFRKILCCENLCQEVSYE